jgi:hypothetical protein
VEGHKHNFISLRIPDVSLIWIWQVDYAKLLEMDSFFTWHIFYKLAKHKISQVKFGKLLELRSIRREHRLPTILDIVFYKERSKPWPKEFAKF